MHIPRLKDDEKESYTIRPALPGDIPFIMELYDLGIKRSLLACRRDEAIWHYELEGKSANNVNRSELFIIDDLSGQPQAFFATSPFAWGEMQTATAYEVKPGVSWSAVTPPLIRFLEKLHAEHSTKQENAKPFGAFGFWLGEDHPVYHVIPSRLPFTRKSYAWYLRVPDLPGFIRKIAPVLESRLEASYIPGYTGEIKITFYSSGLLLTFDHGRLSTVEKYQPTPVGHDGKAAFPGLTFLQLLFGYRSLDELRGSFPDCWNSGDEYSVLLNTLFPRQPSHLWPVS